MLRKRAPALSTRFFCLFVCFPLTPTQGHFNVTAAMSPLRWSWVAKGSGLLLGVELVLQLHEFA